MNSIKTPQDFKHDLGAKLKDKITGFVGVVFSRSQWLTNCNTYGLKREELKDGTPMDLVWFDEQLLELVAPAVIEPERDTGGPTETVMQTNRYGGGH